MWSVKLSAASSSTIYVPSQRIDDAKEVGVLGCLKLLREDN